MEKHIKFGMPLVILLVIASALPASTVVPLNLKNLSVRAHHVTVGRIDSIISYRDSNTGRIMSRIEGAEIRSISGAEPSRFNFEMMGGTADGSRQWIADFPTFKAGDRIVLFLPENTATPGGPTLGLWQGVFFVETDANGVETVADHSRRPVSAIRGDDVVVGQPAQQGAIRAAEPETRVTLDAFLDKVRSLRGLPPVPGNK